MLLGTSSIPYGVSESICRTSLDYELSEIGDYKIHSTSLMPLIDFEEAIELPNAIDESIFINDEDTKLTLDTIIYSQNYLTTRYIGRAPLEFYGPKTAMGREFILICENGNPNYKYRHFGTEDAIKGYNRTANTQEILPK